MARHGSQLYQIQVGRPANAEKVTRRSVRPGPLIAERVVSAFHADDLVRRKSRIVELVDIPRRHRRIGVALVALRVELPSALAIRTIHSE
jgi:hypothetical protein